jgi:hypothetical protein
MYCLQPFAVLRWYAATGKLHCDKVNTISYLYFTDDLFAYFMCLTKITTSSLCVCNELSDPSYVCLYDD